uniref:Uncharacterized protein n=1 Tax=Macrostomum lignano TaxID=282301 RepID=A0A1I8FB34_9PLAT
MTASGRACVPWTGSNSAFNRSLHHSHQHTSP